MPNSVKYSRDYKAHLNTAANFLLPKYIKLISRGFFYMCVHKVK
jgi:hypothetical protein